MIADVPVQFFQSVIAVELAVTGALLWQIRFFESRDSRQRQNEHLPDSRLRLGLALVLGATLFGSLWAIADEGPKWAALAVTVGLALSLTPILLRVLPPLARDAATNERDSDYVITIVGLVLYTAVVAGFLVLLDIAQLPKIDVCHRAIAPMPLATVLTMSLWAWSLAGIGVFLLVYALFVLALVIAGRRETARALAGFIPDCIVLCSRLLKDPRVPRRKKLLLVALAGYLALPFDLVPDFIPVAGQLDDVIVVALVLRSFLKGGGEPLVRSHWPGPERTLALILRLAT